MQALVLQKEELLKCSVTALIYISAFAADVCDVRDDEAQYNEYEEKEEEEEEGESDGEILALLFYFLYNIFIYRERRVRMKGARNRMLRQEKVCTWKW